MGPQAENIFTQLNLTTDEAKVLDTVLTKFDNYFQPQTNVVFERAKLNQQYKKRANLWNSSSQVCISWQKLVDTEMRAKQNTSGIE